MIEYMNESQWLLKAWTHSLLPYHLPNRGYTASAHAWGPHSFRRNQLSAASKNLRLGRRDKQTTISSHSNLCASWFHPGCDVTCQVTREPPEVRGMPQGTAHLLGDSFLPQVIAGRKGDSPSWIWKLPVTDPDQPRWRLSLPHHHGQSWLATHYVSGTMSVIMWIPYTPHTLTF